MSNNDNNKDFDSGGSIIPLHYAVQYSSENLY